MEMNSNLEQYLSTYSRLTGEGYSPQQDLKARKIVSVSENGTKYKLATDDKYSAVFQIDGYIIKKVEGRKCDKLILVRKDSTAKEEDWTELFVELKGTDILRAIDQLRATLKNPKFRHQSNKDIRARIVANSYPSNKANSDLEKAKKDFRKNFNCDLRSVKNGQEDKL